MEPSDAARTERESPRLHWTAFPPPAGEDDEDHDVVAGLEASPKWLPCRFFYDARGSALFERICELPEYDLTRTEAAILEAAAPEIARIVGPAEVLELGSGSARKTRVLLAAMGAEGHPLRFLPIDVSAEVLKHSSRELVAAFPGLEVWGLIGTYEQALAGLPKPELPARLLLFLGSTIGNLTEAEYRAFLAGVRASLGAGDYFLVGFDLQKAPAIIEAAYNDSEGVTAAFNLNLLVHLNRLYEGDFEPGRFAHRAFYDRREHRIEMHLESLAEQRVALGALDLEVGFAAGETVRTEISRKFHMPTVDESFAEAGFEPVRHWTDGEDRFALALFRAG